MYFVHLHKYYSQNVRNLPAKIITDVQVAYFDVGKEVKLGEPLLPLLCNVALRKRYKNRRRILEQFRIHGAFIQKC